MVIFFYLFPYFFSCFYALIANIFVTHNFRQKACRMCILRIHKYKVKVHFLFHSQPQYPASGLLRMSFTQQYRLLHSFSLKYIHCITLSVLSFPNSWDNHINTNLIELSLLNFHPMLCSAYDPISTLYYSPVNPPNECVHNAEHVSKPSHYVWMSFATPVVWVINSSLQGVVIKNQYYRQENCVLFQALPLCKLTRWFHLRAQVSSSRK